MAFSSCSSSSSAPLYLLLMAVAACFPACSAQSGLCRTTCGDIPIRFPFGVDGGCGSPYYHNLLVCNAAVSPPSLHLRTPSGAYAVKNISYADPHLVVSDPSMWSCDDVDGLGAAVFRPPDRPPFSLDAGTPLSLSPKNDYLFFNCSKEDVIVEPKTSFCDRFPDRCDSVCDSAAYLCRNIPGCSGALGGSSGPPAAAPCCSYFPKASESLRLMLRHCTTYTSVYWRTTAGPSFPPYDQVPEYGVRVDFQIPVTTKCLQCEDADEGGGGGGACGFDTASRAFLCLCKEGNATSTCGGSSSRRRSSTGVVVGATIGAAAAGMVGVGVLAWCLRKTKTNKVTCGVQSNENRLF